MKKETKKKVKIAVGVTSAVVSTAFVGLTAIAKLNKGKSVYDDDLNEKNPLEGKKVKFVENENDKENADGVKGHLEAVGESNHQAGFYERYVKRGIDVVLSFGGLVVLSPIMGVIALAIKVEDPGPVLFTQKRMGQNKKYFKLHKFRSMKMSTPHDVPTHMLDNPDQYITKVGKFLRAHSLDELPQIWDIFIGNMSVIGPRPGLWNQDILTAERDKYGANDVKPGLTGWAQINGRDELEIPDKAKLDGDYVQNMGPKMDAKVFLKSLHVFGKDESVVEGGTGEMKKEKNEKKKILFLANHFITLFSFRKELIQKLVNDGHDVYLSIPEDENHYFENLGCHIILTDIDRRGVNPKNDLKLIYFYKKMISEIKPDIIFSYTIKPNIYGSLVSNHLHVKQVCNITGTGATFLNDNVVAKICKLLYRISIRNCYKVFFQNTGDRDFFVKNNLVNDNYEMLPGSGCNLEEHKYKPMIESDVIRFIFIGRVMKLKGIDEYLEAAKIIKNKYSNTEFLIAGWNEEEEYIKIVNNYQEKGYVNYIGFRKDISDWIEKCNCTVLPSHGGEGVPNVLLESAATGRACIGSNINGTADVIDDGVTGYLFEKGNTESLVDKLEKFINLTFEERKSMGKAGRNKIEKEFDRNIVVNKYCEEVEKSDKF
ncbi:glycosyltransferase [Coprobacillus sp. AF36-10BH]|nr:glycosyltransferase [Coprobacillus sp. AF36-10BH]